VGRKNSIDSALRPLEPMKDSPSEQETGGSVIRLAGRAFVAWFTSRADLIAENLCLRQQLIVLHRRTPRPRLRDGDRRWTAYWR